MKEGRVSARIRAGGGDCEKNLLSSGSTPARQNLFPQFFEIFFYCRVLLDRSGSGIRGNLHESEL